MGLQEKLSEELKSAMKSQEAVRVSTLRMLISAIRNKEIAKQKALADGDVLDVISTEAKSRKESIAEYQKAGRTDLASKEEAELKILQAYLPEAMSDAELRKLAQQAIQTANAAGPQDMGKVMSALMPLIKGRADGRQAQQVVQELLKK